MMRMPAAISKPSRLESVITAVALVLIALGLVSIAASLIVGMSDRFAVAEGIWPVVYGIAFYGLPLGFALMIVSVVLGVRRRRAALRGGEEIGA